MDLLSVLREGWARLRAALARGRPKRVGILSGVAYVLVYLFSLGHIAITPGRAAFPGAGVFTYVGLENLWRQRAPYNYEPVAIFQPVDGFAIFLAVPNLLLAIALGTLVALNVAVFLHGNTQSRHCGLAKSASGLVASLPAFLTGFACCAPSLVILLGAVFASSFLLFVEVAMPAAIAALILSLAWNLFRPVPGD
ncbi:MAG: hypothetical protein HY724_09775 [Candidatus Rokubacteria bacterium]|nr:hypothetical protein [Candidatus Rokubacteria bacterium]